MRRDALPALHDYVDMDELQALIARARAEDLGPDGQDVTSDLFIPASLTGQAVMVAREAGRVSGVALLPHIAAAYDPSIDVRLHHRCGHGVEPGDAIATFAGPMRSILAMERVALNFLSHLSGIATLTSRYVEKCADTRARVFDTRKTIPGLRGLAKFAVACGGGGTHRIGLYDAMLIKDNHLAHVPLAELAATLAAAVEQARDRRPPLKFVQVEVDTLEQLAVVLPTGIDIVLLDNMSPDQLRDAANLRDRVASRVELEASGGVNLQTIEAIARTGVDRISVGALTHSAPALDLGLDVA